MSSDVSPRPTVAELFPLLLNASTYKEYEANWLPSAKKVYRDASGKFGSNSGDSAKKTDPTQAEGTGRKKRGRSSLLGERTVKIAEEALAKNPSQNWTPEKKRATTETIQAEIELIKKQDKLNTQDGSDREAYLSEAVDILMKSANASNVGAVAYAETALSVVSVTPNIFSRKVDKDIEKDKREALEKLQKLKGNSLQEKAKKAISDAANIVKTTMRSILSRSNGEVQAASSFAGKQILQADLGAEAALAVAHWHGQLNLIKEMVAAEAKKLASK